LTLNEGRRYIQANKIHFNGSLIGRDILEDVMFDGRLGEESYGAKLKCAGYDLVIDINSNILHPSCIENDKVRMINIPIIGPIVVWQLRPWKAHMAIRESIIKRRILHHPLRLFAFDLLLVIAVYLFRLIFEKKRLKKLRFYICDFTEGIKVAININKPIIRSDSRW